MDRFLFLDLDAEESSSEDLEPCKVEKVMALGISMLRSSKTNEWEDPSVLIFEQVTSRCLVSEMGNWKEMTETGCGIDW